MAIPRTDAAHLLRRVGFGGTPTEIDRVAAATSWAAAVDMVLDTSAEPPVTVPAAINNPALGDYDKWVAAVQWWVERMRTTPTPVVEKLALIWHNHFVSGSDKVPMPLMWDQIQLYRTRGRGDFHDLVQRMAVHPAMLLYLDNATNVTAGGENENFAREVMELFTMGNGTFAESDVIAMARAWTGHGLNWTTYAYEWHPSQHDNGQKTLFGKTANWDGPATLTEILKGDVKAVTSARFIVTKLWSYLAAPNPDPALVAELATGFIAADLDITALLRAILLRPEFLAPATRTALVRSPVEWMVALLKALDMPASAGHPDWFLEPMGQKLFEPPNVAGWKQNSFWISTSTVWAKARYATWIRWPATDDDGPYKRFAGLADRPVDQIVSTIVATFGLEDASAATRAVITNWATALKANSGIRWAIRPSAIPLAALSPDFQLA